MFVLGLIVITIFFSSNCINFKKIAIRDLDVLVINEDMPVANMDMPIINKNIPVANGEILRFLTQNCYLG